MSRVIALAVLVALAGLVFIAVDEAAAPEPARPGALVEQTTNSAGDWPQWRGPNRDGRSSETGLLSTWPDGGPRQVWSVSGMGTGYGSISTSGSRIFAQGMRGRESFVVSLDRGTGRQAWLRVIGGSGRNNQGNGPRATPTVDGDRVYALGENGDLACLAVADGRVIWQRNILRDFGGRNISWLISQSPLIDGNAVIVTPGGRGAGMVSLDKMTGETIWTSQNLSDSSGYASPVVADIDGVRTIMTFTASAGVGVRASDGHLMWRYPAAANNTANIATPVISGNTVFFSSAYGTGGGLLDLAVRDGVVTADERYFTREMQNHHGGMVLVDGHLYGFNNSILTALAFETGQRRWRDRSVGKGSLTFADGHLYIVGEQNLVGLVAASPAGYVERGRFRIPDQGAPSWAHPVVSGGRLYIRNQDTLTSYDIRAQ